MTPDEIAHAFPGAIGMARGLRSSGSQRLRALDMIRSIIAEDVTRQVHVMVHNGWSRVEAIDVAAQNWTDLVDAAIATAVAPDQGELLEVPAR